MTFKINERVKVPQRFTTPSGRLVPEGATATVTDVFSNGEVRVEWDKGFNLVNGRFRATRFVTLNVPDQPASMKVTERLYCGTFDRRGTTVNDLMAAMQTQGQEQPKKRSPREEFEAAVGDLVRAHRAHQASTEEFLALAPEGGEPGDRAAEAVVIAERGMVEAGVEVARMAWIFFGPRIANAR